MFGLLLCALLALQTTSVSCNTVLKFPLNSQQVIQPMSEEEAAKVEHLLLDRRRAVGTFVTVPLVGITSVVFSAEMAIGTPPQNLSLLVDTGSANMAVAATSGAGAPQYFNRSISTTFQSEGSTVSTTYLSGSWTGDRSRDVFKFAATTEAAINATFAAITESKGFFRSPSALGVYGQYAYDGILGMGFQVLANPVNNRIKPFFDELILATNISNAFTVQLCDFQVTAGQLVVRPGQLVLGGVESDVASLAVGAFFYTPIVEEKYYSVKMTGISVGGSRLDNTCDYYNSPNPAFLDSGSTNIIVPQIVFDQLRSSMTVINDALTSSEEDLFYNGLACVTMPQATLAILPNITIHIASETSGKELNFVVRPWQYLRANNATSTPNVICRSWGFSASCNTILGSVFMDGYTVFHDRANMRMGIARSTCGVQNPVTVATAITETNLPSGFDISKCQATTVCSNGAAQLGPGLSVGVVAMLSGLLAAFLLVL